MPEPININFQNVPVTSTPTLIGSIQLNGYASRLSLEVINTGSVALSNFTVSRVLNDTGSPLSFVGGTDFNATSNAILCVSTVSPATLAAAGGNNTSWFDLDPGAAVQVNLYAQTASGNTTITVIGSGHFR